MRYFTKKTTLLYFWVILLNWFSTFGQSTIPVYINEFMASNASTINDIAGEFEDWIELHNGLSSSIDIGGFYLSDNPNNLTKYQIPANTIINGGGFVLFWASGDFQSWKSFEFFA